MAKLTEEELAEMATFINDVGQVEYHKKCKRCTNDCKQTFKCKEVICPNYKRRQRVQFKELDGRIGGRK